MYDLSPTIRNREIANNSRVKYSFTRRLLLLELWVVGRLSTTWERDTLLYNLWCCATITRMEAKETESKIKADFERRSYLEIIINTNTVTADASNAKYGRTPYNRFSIEDERICGDAIIIFGSGM